MQNQWYIARDGKQYGPVSDNDLAQLINNRELADDDYLWRHGFDNWLPASQVPEVRHMTAQGTMGAGMPAGGPGGQVAGQLQGPIGGQMQGQPQTQFQEQIPQEQMQGQTGAPLGQERVDSHAFQNDPHSPIQHDSFQPDAFQNDAGMQGLQEQDLTPTAPLTQSGSLLPDDGLQMGAGREDNYQLQELGYDTNADGGYQEAGSPYSQDEPDNTMLDTAQNVQDAYGEPMWANRDGELGSDVQDLVEDHGLAGSAPLAQNQMDAAALQNDMNDQFGNAYNVSSNNKRSALPSLKKSGISWPVGVGIGIAAVLLLAVGAMFALPFIVPPETVKNQISSIIKKKTGRDVTFKGKMSYRFFPSFGLDLNNIIIHNPASIKGPDFISIGRLQANLKLLPLISKRVEVDRIVLHRPEITLITDKSGKTNYEIKTASLERFLKTGKRLLRSFKVAQSDTLDASDIIAEALARLEREEAEAAAKAKKSPSPDAANPKGPTETAEKASPKNDIQIGEIEIINGAVKLIDQASNSETELNAINMVVKAPASDKDIVAVGSVRFKEDRITVNGVISTLGALLAGEQVKTNLTANSDKFEGKFDGQVRLGDTVEFRGNTDFQTFSLQKLLNWFDIDVPRQGYGGAYIRGQVLGTPESITLKNATIKVDQSTLIGDLRFKPKGGSGNKPLIQAVLKTDTLNIDTYLNQSKEIKRGALDAPRKTAVAAWNSNNIDLSFLKDFDGTIQLSAARVVAMGHPLEKVQLNAKLTAGLMNAALPGFNIYGGSGIFSMAINGAKPRPSMKSRVELKKVQIKPLLVNAAGIKLLSGAADVSFDLVSAGNSQRAMISSLNGTGKISVADGAIEGINIPGILRNLQKGQLTDLTSKPSEKTDFSELTGSFTIANGVLKNEDLAMKGPLLRMTGKGTLNLPTEQIDYGLNPKLVGSLRGQGGNTDKTGIQIPLRIKGPFSNPKILPDLEGLLSNNGEVVTKAVKTVEQVVKKIKKKKISSDEMKSLLDGMLSGDGDASNVLDGIF